MTWLRSALFNLLFFGWTALALLAALPLVLLPRRHWMTASRVWARGVAALLRAVVGVEAELRGEVGLLQRPGVIAIKHQSAWDTIVFYLFARDPAYVMKQELMRIPLYGWYARRQGMIPIDRKAGAKALRGLVEDARRALDAGRQVLIFPQGTRVAPGTKAPYLPGVAALYTQLGRPVVPVALNSGRFWGRRSFVKRPGRIVVEVLPEIPAGLARRAFMAELERRIETATARLEAEARGNYPQG